MGMGKRNGRGPKEDPRPSFFLTEVKLRYFYF